MASIIKNVEYIQKHFDLHFEFLLKKLNEDNISLKGKSTNSINKLIYPIVNLIDFKFNGDYSQIINKTIDDIHSMYGEWYIIAKNNFTTFNYIENNNIILDYRINGIGYYWVDLNCYYSCEMLFRLNNCARVNSYQNFLELREYTSDGYNHSRIVVVIDKLGFINQIRGDYNLKPDTLYKDFIYDLFLNYNKLKGFKFLFTKETDFTHMDLSDMELANLKTIRPEFFSLI
jgi:hypothetical protein